MSGLKMGHSLENLHRVGSHGTPDAYGSVSLGEHQTMVSSCPMSVIGLFLQSNEEKKLPLSPPFPAQLNKSTACNAAIVVF